MFESVMGANQVPCPELLGASASRAATTTRRAPVSRTGVTIAFWASRQPEHAYP